jgi:hypothetical protein
MRMRLPLLELVAAGATAGLACTSNPDPPAARDERLFPQATPTSTVPPPSRGRRNVQASASEDPSDAATDASDAASGLGIDCATDADHPVELGCTGLYSNWPSRTVASDVRAYSPGYTLFSDGAEKRRWIHLPPTTTIDTSNMDEWAFPVGTKLWKEFRLGGGGGLVETRLLWKRGAGDWYRTTYAWSGDGTSATELTTGQTNVDGGTYEIPSQTMCDTCHQGRIDGVLGFEAVSLAASGASGLTMNELLVEGLVTNAPAAPVVVPGDATTSAALGWLHANCGEACHNRSPQAFAGPTGLFMRLEVATLGSPQSTDTWQTAVNVPSGFQPYPGAGFVRIAPNDTSRSAIYFRANFRDDMGQGFQMPPIDTHVIDTSDVAALAAWIATIQ